MALDWEKIDKELKEQGDATEWVKIKDLPVGNYKVKVFGVKWETNKDYFGTPADEATFMFEFENGTAASNSFVFKHTDEDDKHVKLLGALKGTVRTLGINSEGNPEEIIKRVQDHIELDNGIQAMIEIFKIEGLENNRSKFIKPDTAATVNEAPAATPATETPAQAEAPKQEENFEVDLDAIKF